MEPSIAAAQPTDRPADRPPPARPPARSLCSANSATVGAFGFGGEAVCGVFAVPALRDQALSTALALALNSHLPALFQRLSLSHLPALFQREHGREGTEPRRPEHGREGTASGRTVPQGPLAYPLIILLLLLPTYPYLHAAGEAAVAAAAAASAASSAPSVHLVSKVTGGS